VFLVFVQGQDLQFVGCGVDPLPEFLHQGSGITCTLGAISDLLQTPLPDMGHDLLCGGFHGVWGGPGVSWDPSGPGGVLLGPGGGVSSLWFVLDSVP